MLLQFTIKNYKVFGDEIKLNMIASADDTRESDNVIDLPKFGLRVLKSAVMYGANASGKSKFIEAIQFMKQFILTSAETQSSRKIDTAPFRLNTGTEKAPSLFEIIFILDNEMYRYGFEATSEKVVSEWLFHRPKTKEIEIFYRQEQNFDIHKSFKIKDLIDKNRIKPNTLLLSKADAENDSLAAKIIQYFNENLLALSGLKEGEYKITTALRMQEDEKFKSAVEEFIKSADIGIESFSFSENGNNFKNLLQEFAGFDIGNKLEDAVLDENTPLFLKEFIGSPSDFFKNMEKTMKNDGLVIPTVYAAHQKFDENDLLVSNVLFSLSDDESAGTQKYFALAGPILEALANGTTLIIDELDAKLHPNLVHKIIEIFNSEKSNPNNAQLIFNTHDTNLLSCGVFRRDQIWFVEKNRYGSAQLYSLADFKTDVVRKNDNFEKNYIAGRYGAIPYLGDFDKLFNL